MKETLLRRSAERVIAKETGLRTGRPGHVFLMDVPTYHCLIVTDAPSTSR
jgi:hypothetical protein